MEWNRIPAFKYLPHNRRREEMKLIVAMIQPHKLPDVKKQLYAAEV